MEPPSTVAELLANAALSEYEAAFEEQGWDSLPHLRDINEEELPPASTSC